MAAKKQTSSHAQKAASKSKRPAETSRTKPKKDDVPAPEQEHSSVPVRAISSLVIALLFLLSLIALLWPEGKLITLYRSAVLGLVGNAAFSVSIPALLYLFIIHAFSAKKPIVMRTVCLISFILLCGCLSHLTLMDQAALTVSGTKLIRALYTGGIAGTTGGVLCGGLTMGIRFLCGRVLSYILLIAAAVLTLLASVQLTIPSIVRAVRNRPRPAWEEEKPAKKEPQEPAAVVVNHLATKRIEYEEKKRARAAEKANIDIPLDDEPSSDGKTDKKVKHPANPRARDLMEQIDGDVEAPVAAAAEPVADDCPSLDPDLAPDTREEPASQEVLNRFPEEPVIPEPVTDSGRDVSEEMPPLMEQEPPLPEQPSAEPTRKQNEAEPAVKLQQLETPVRKVSAQDAMESAAMVAQEIAETAAAEKPVYCFPPINLLRAPQSGGADGTEEMRENSRRLNETLESFHVDAHIINVTRGPSVTRYEVELDKGVRLNKLTSCADDIALSLGASGVRIAAVTGKISVVGIEVPNRTVTTVTLREVIDSREFASAKSKSSFAVGKDIGGSCIVGNIAKLPHMLIAGTTGSGKSVCMNSIIISLLYKASPDEVKLIMVDPKMVELGIYNGIPHLLIPVVTDPKKAAGSLQWAVTEMMRRYRAMSDAGVRDLESYNAIIDSQEMEGVKLPQVVVIIDELADLMLVAAKEVEESICRIAQMGRAAGIHLIIATQRPSADVITGLMKANIPSRIAFAVASAMESRIILDTQGAEKLVGKGDMLYAPIGCGKPKRVQGCFVSDGEVEAVANYVKSHYNVDYDQQVMEEIDRKAAQSDMKGGAAPEPEANADELAGDEMLPAAVDVILETGQASVSMLQRRLKLGYARAARIVDEMEEQGIVGPFKGSKPREILITKEAWQARQGGQVTGRQMQFSDLEEPEEETEDFE